jgi:phosphatidylglycerol:prolipoprotein diacylglycerol transferase
MPSIFNQTYGLSLLTFGFFIAVALLAGIYMFRDAAKTTGCDPQRIDGLCIWMLIAAIFGARLFYFINHPDAMAGGVMELLRVWNGGVSLTGGAAVAAVVGFGYTRSFNMPVLQTLDAFAPAIAIGQFFTWLGCFFSGFCRKLPADGTWDAATILNNPGAAPQVQLHPTALFIAAGHFVIFGILLLARQRRRFSGHTFWLYVLMVAFLGLVVGIISAGNATGMFIGLPPEISVYAVLVVVAAIALLILRRRGKRPEGVE